MHIIFDTKFLKFIIVGIANTIFSALLMFLLYNIARWGYWGASSVSYVLASILSFVLNKNYTFQNKDSIGNTALRFTINIIICYIIAYSVAKPLVIFILSNLSKTISINIMEQISMIFGMCLFTGLNYFGQRFFAFNEKTSTI